MKEDRIRFIVQGPRPAFGKEGNDFIASLNLGVEGAYLPFQFEATALRNSQDEEGIEADFAEIAKVMSEEFGCKNVSVNLIG